MASVVTYGADPTGVNDSTAAIQACCNANTDVNFPDGSYRISNPITVRSGTTVWATPNQVTIFPNPTSSFYQADGNLAYSMFVNQHYDATSLTDSNIAFYGLNFNLTGLQLANQGGSHIIRMLYVNHVDVQNCKFYSNTSGNGTWGDATAFIACQDTSIQNCFSQGFDNCPFDHWQGCVNAKVLNCTIRNPLQWGILFTGSPTVNTNAPLTSSICLIFGNTIIGAGSISIWVEGGWAGPNGVSGTRYVKIIGNHIDGSGISNEGIRISGSYGVHIVTDNTLLSNMTNGGSAINLTNDGVGQDIPNGSIVSKNSIYNWNSNANPYGCIVACGNNNIITDNNLSWSFYTYMIGIFNPDCIVANNLGPAGSSGRYFGVNSNLTFLQDPNITNNTYTLSVT